ncbi:rare lipoprotein A [Mesonia phycicola]|uniref:Probable endolytic peptidoglycan transglycosylase RlpA n=1 Tax=Mesonia phycicola TaxID=579105 RepID=A0A1M6BTT4_9FLAO|nr:septal ring lytic transglycosylase RlpA family protein [Mesonia phycicola]SHI52101.1 rare lipoprotein A [Mesonia phycicola]
MKKFLITICFLFISVIAFAQVQTGKASFYADKFEGRRTASGVKYYHNKATAAHRHLPFGTKVRVTNLANNKSVVVEINDRGPFVSGRIIDLSKSAAQELGYVPIGVTDVAIEVVGNADDTIEDVSTPNQSVADNSSSENNNETSTTTPKNSSAVTNVEPNEFYELNINKVDEPDWFGVQVGSFQEVANLIRLADNLKISYEENVTVQVKTIQNIKVYSLILGKFKTRKQADRFKEEVSVKYPGSFTIDFSALQQ